MRKTLKKIREIQALARDFAIIIFGIIIAIVIVKTGLVDELFSRTQGLTLVTSFIAGFFFTSVFTVTLATVILANLMQISSIPAVAFFAAIGAVFGDLILLRLVKDRISKDVKYLVDLVWHKRIRHFHKLSLWKMLWPLVGSLLIILPPFPDEVGLTILGLSKLKTRNFILLSFLLNFIGIFIIGLIARSFI